MNSTYLVYPMGAMVCLTAVVLTLLFFTRLRAVRSGETNQLYYKTYEGTESRASRQLSRHFTNLFEAPVLFYVACIAAMIIGSAGSIFLALAWTYVAARLAHAIIHIGKNKIIRRIVAYMFSWLVLLSMWATLMVDLATRG